MTKLDEKMAPRPVSGVDFNNLTSQPSAEDFFVLSRVDGSQTIDQLCTISGLGKTKTLESITRLKELGLISFPEESSSASTTGNPNEADELGAAIVARFKTPFESYTFDADLLAQQVELSEAFKREILFVHEHLDELDYYELLGTHYDATRRELRRNYFSMSKRYHPDRFFRKVLGSYQVMIDTVFQRITAAYQTLSNQNKRADYDQALEARLTPSPPTSHPSRGPSDAKREMAFKLVTRRADEAFANGSIDVALSEYKKALSLKRDATLATRIARQLLEAHRFSDALAFGRAAQKIDPSSVDALTTLGEVYESIGNPSEAVRLYQEALSINPSQSVLKTRLADLKE